MSYLVIFTEETLNRLGAVYNILILDCAQYLVQKHGFQSPGGVLQKRCS